MSIKSFIERHRPGLGLPLRNGVMIAVATVLISLFVPNRYTSEAQILPKDLNSGGPLSNLMATAAAFGVNLGSSDDSASYVDVLNSRKVAEVVLSKKYDFGMRPLFFLHPRPKSMTLYDYIDADNKDLAVEKYGKKIFSVDRDLKSELITVRVTTDSPELSKQALETAISQLEAFVVASGQRSGKDSAAFSERSLQGAILAAKQSEDRLREFADAHRNYSLSPDPEIHLTGARLEADLAMHRQMVQTLTMSFQQNMLNGSNDTPVLNILDHPNMPIQKSFPSRGLWAIGAFVMGFLVTLGWKRREAVMGFLLERPSR